MNESLINTLAEMLGAPPLEDSGKGSLEPLLPDPEALQLLGLLLTPELQVENNYPLPFETATSLFVGSSQGFLLPLSSQGVTFSGDTRKLKSRLKVFLRAESDKLVASYLDFQYEPKDGSIPLQLRVRTDERDECAYVEISSSGVGDRKIEFWQSGSLILKAPAKVLAGSSPFRIKPGLAVDIRVSGAQEGIRILMVETEFSSSEWRSAFISECLIGALGEAGRILRIQLGSQGLSEWLLARIESQIQAIAAVTRTDGFLLTPSPITRSGAIPRTELLSVYGLVWNGIVHYWPAAADIPNPWPEIARVQLPADEARSFLNVETRVLAEACLLAANGDPIPGENHLAFSQDPRIRNGWAALLGWNAILSKQYEKSHQLLASTEPDEKDPYLLAMTQALAGHLERCESTVGKVEESSSDDVWRRILAPLL